MCQVTLRTADAIPANFITNQFALTGEVTSPTDAAAVVTALGVFYEAMRLDILGTGLAQNNHIVKLYDLPGLTPNYPFYEGTFNFASTFGTPSLPSEVALCLSFQGARVAGQFQARRRGRIFIGPIQTTVSSAGRPDSPSRTTIVDAAEGLYDDLDLIASAGSWAVWSTVTATAIPLVDCWVDDAFDTQRSRGVAPSTRTTKSFV